MPLDGPVPDWLFSGVAVLTLWAVMLGIGLSIVPDEFRWLRQHPWMLGKGLFAVLVAVPACALAVVRNLDLGRAAEIGVVLMAISPGAPIALRRSIGAGGRRAYATALQISVAVLAVVSMPLWIAALDRLYDGSASIDPRHLLRQVFFAQLLPLGLGLFLSRYAAPLARRVSAWMAPIAKGLLLLLTVLVIINIWQTVAAAGPHAAGAVVATTLLALACGHLLGGPDPSTRTATAVASAVRNPGLALLVVSLNGASPAIMATVLAYLLVSACTVMPYLLWRRRAGDAAPD